MVCSDPDSSEDDGIGNIDGNGGDIDSGVPDAIVNWKNYGDKTFYRGPIP